MGRLTKWVFAPRLPMTNDDPRRRITQRTAGGETVPAAAVEPEEAKRPTPALDPFEREILVFVLNWSRCGGAPAEEVIPRFGIPPDQFDGRLNQILGAGVRRVLNDDDRTLLARTIAVLRTRPPLRMRGSAVNS